MLNLTAILAFLATLGLSVAAPVSHHDISVSSLKARGDYKFYTGNGTVAAGWPAQSDWKPFDQAWDLNRDTMQDACINNGGTINNSEEEMEAIKAGILEEAKSSQIPSELILAVIMQESKGCVRAPTSAHSAANPGLMQCSGTATCNPGTPVFPCPSDTIRTMIHEGTAGDGLATTLKISLEAFAGITDESKWYKAVRRYNAGPNMMSAEDLTQGPTACYASDIANRLVNPFAE